LKRRGFGPKTPGIGLAGSQNRVRSNAGAVLPYPQSSPSRFAGIKTLPPESRPLIAALMGNMDKGRPQ